MKDDLKKYKCYNFNDILELLNRYKILNPTLLDELNTSKIKGYLKDQKYVFINISYEFNELIATYCSSICNNCGYVDSCKKYSLQYKEFRGRHYKLKRIINENI